MIRYFIINNNCRGSRYGVGTYIRQLSEGLKIKGNYDISYIDLYSDARKFTVSIDVNGNTSYKIPAIECSDEQYCRRAIYLLLRHIPDKGQIVFHFNFIHHECMVNMLRAYYTNCRIIFTVHYLTWCFQLNGNYNRFKYILNSRGKKKNEDYKVYSSYISECNFLHACDELMVLSNFTKYILKKDYNIAESKLHLVYNGLNGRTITHNFDKDNIILFVGRLDEIKGVEYLIRAYKRICQKYPDYYLYLVGDGDYSKYMSLCGAVRKNVVFTGKVDRKCLIQLYKKATIGVLPSFHEQCSYTAIEMLQYGIPLIITDSTGLGETLCEIPENIVNIPKGKFNSEEFVISLSNKMESLLSNKDLCKKQSHMMCEIFWKKYTQAEMIKKTSEIVAQSFAKHDYIVPEDIYPLFDDKMFTLINQRPDLDLDYFGLSGIGVYLWFRICQLRGMKDVDSRVKYGELCEFMIYYIDWLTYYINTEYSNETKACVELQFMLIDMFNHGFFITRVKSIIDSLNINANALCQYSKNDILRNTLKIYNCKL